MYEKKKLFAMCNKKIYLHKKKIYTQHKYILFLI